MSTAREKYASFFVRIWQEPRERDEEEAEWRGSIEHVQSGEKEYFKEVGVLVDFIEHFAGDWDSADNGRKYIT